MAITRYAEREDLTISEEALEGYSDEVVDDFLDKASQYADGFMLMRFTLPLVQWGADLRMQVAAIATYWLMSHRGFTPGGEDNTDIRDRFKDARDWLTQLSKGQVTPVGFVDSGGGAANATDAAGELRQTRFVTQSYPGGGSTAPDFWDRSARGPIAVSGPPKKRNW